MRNLAEDKHTRGESLCQLWRQLKAETPRSGAYSDEKREDHVIAAFAEEYAQEIIEAVAGDPVGRVFCGLWIVIDGKQARVRVDGDLTAILEGVRRVLDSYAENRKKPAGEQAKAYVSETLTEFREQRIARVRELTPAELLSAVLKVPRPNAAVILEHLTSEQQRDLLWLLQKRAGGKRLIFSPGDLSLEHEPDDGERWLMWYIARLIVTAPEVMGCFSDDSPRPTIVVLGEGGRPNLTDTAGQPLNLAGPQLAHLFMTLANESNKYGHQIKDPESVSRIARSLDVSRARVNRWLKEDPPIELAPDGKGGVNIRSTLGDMLRSIEIAKGRKRGPRPKGS